MLKSTFLSHDPRKGICNPICLLELLSFARYQQHLQVHWEIKLFLPSLCWGMQELTPSPVLKSPLFFGNLHIPADVVNMDKAQIVI